MTPSPNATIIKEFKATSETNTQPNFLIVIPARKNSSFKFKNLYPLNGINLIQHTFEAVERVLKERDMGVVVSTDDHYVKAFAEERGFIAKNRPAKLSTDRVTLDAVIVYISETFPDYDYYICLQPTSPLRTDKHILEAIEKLIDDEADSLISVIEERKSIWKADGRYIRPIVERRKNRQESKPVYVANGAIFITRKEILKSHKRRTGGRVSLYVMEEKDSVDIHDKDDIKLAEYFLKR